ncbi:ABC transporter ATP-binding protein [Staphylococcus simulans]|uniref:ABC transporter ATP-binding protein n=1 Tax=Staphylococcus simulans TaxID=1286 RepID=UPI0021D3C988|nr:ABC transporter ATP-binding protein [Staphylococcus simulans]UXR48043.1 ABC transporter ATP-binding protein [Staphylococcus simulans]
MTPLLSVHHLTKHFSNSRFSINDVSFQVDPGEIVALIGKNGSGKSTLIRMIVGDYPLTSGEIYFFGQRVSPEDTDYKNDISVVFDSMDFTKNMTVDKLNRMFQKVFRHFDSTLFNDYIQRFELPEKQTVKFFSRGMSMKLSMAVALSHKSRLLILDEATAGLDAASRDEIQDEIEKFVHDSNRGVLMTSHIAEDIDRLATKLVFLRHGQVYTQIDKAALFNNYARLTCDETEFEKLEDEDVLAKKHHLGEVQAIVLKNERTLSFDLEPIEYIDQVNKIILRGEDI